VRVARVCPREGCFWREFGNPDAQCPQHGVGEFQPNNTYMGVPVPQHPDFRPPKAPKKGGGRG
jgi:hypothetical protein